MVVPTSPANVLIYIFSHLTINLEKQLEQTDQSECVQIEYTCF